MHVNDVTAVFTCGQGQITSGCFSLHDRRISTKPNSITYNNNINSVKIQPHQKHAQEEHQRYHLHRQ
jgi:hypothetical protein